MADEHDSLVTTQGINGWRIVQAISGGLVVAGILALSGMVVGLRDTVREHDLLIQQFVLFKEDGKRYTEKDGSAERDLRIAADVSIGTKIDSMFANQFRYWSAFREHIKESHHQGAGYRLKTLEANMKDHRHIDETR